MSVQFYKDIDRLHELITPEMRYSYAMRQMIDAQLEIIYSVAKLIAASTEDYTDAIEMIRERVE